MALSGSLNFISASITGSANIKVDFVGLNTLIVDPLTASSNDLGLPQSAASTAYYNSLVEAIGGPEPNQLNSLLLHRNGPYQHPMWRQYRGGDHVVARTLRLNNTMSVDQNDPDPIRRHQGRAIVELSKYESGPPGSSNHDHKSVDATNRTPVLTQYYEPSVISKYKPFIYSTAIAEGSNPAIVRVTLVNQIEYFKNKGLNDSLKIASMDPSAGTLEGYTKNNQKYYQILHMAKDLGGTNFIYSERMFPKSINAYRSFKFNKPNYEEVVGFGSNGFDRENNRSFWRTTHQGTGLWGAAASSTTGRMRNKGCFNSQGIKQEIEDANHSDRAQYTGSLALLSASVLWAHTSSFIFNGIITNQVNTLTGGITSGGTPVLQPSGAFVQLEAYQPYMMPLLSMWPLDVRSDIYDSPAYLTSSIGGKGKQIGLTPNSSTSSFVSMSQTAKLDTLGAWYQRTAGELVYSTKPTIYFYRTGSALNGIDGYRNVTASMQYNRHTYPYNTPFYATHKIRGRDPMYDSYNDFKDSDNLKQSGRDFSIIPEFKMSDHMDYYMEEIKPSKDKKIFKIKNDAKDHKSADVIPKIVRVANVYDNVNTTHLRHKLNFLRIDGADVTASSGTESLLLANPSVTNYDYNDISGAALNNFNDAKFSYTSDSGSVAFYEKYSHPDSLVNFSYLIDQKEKGFDDDRDTIPNKITFTCHGVKKLLPYNGFYPVLRTTQIGNTFKSAFNPHIKNINPTIPGGQTADDAQIAALQTILEPFAAPGVLFNSIKSGIAVDYPIYYRDDSNSIGYEPLYYQPTEFTSASSGAPRTPGTVGMVQPQFSASFNYGGGYMMGSSRCMPTILNNRPNERFTFENLYDIKSLRKFSNGFFAGVSDFVDLDRSSGSYTEASYGTPAEHGGLACLKGAPYAKLDTSNMLDTKNMFIYESSINNFLCETMEFFLADSSPGVKLPVITSRPKADDITIDLNADYYMEVTLRMGFKQVMAEGPRNAGIGGGSFQDNIYVNKSMMRGYIYGPPIEAVAQQAGATVVGTSTPDSISGSTDTTSNISPTEFESYIGANLQDPAYHAYTPPYFYGDSTFVIAYTASVNALLSTEVKSEISIPELLAGARHPSGSFTSEEYLTSSLDGSGIDQLCLYVPTNASVSSGSAVRMKPQASVDVFNEEVKLLERGGSNKTYDMLYIAPKWVCPVLDFSSSVSVVENKTIGANGTTITGAYTTIANSYHDYTTGKGMWGGYGVDPYDASAMKAAGLSTDNKGIFLEINDSFVGKSNSTLTSPRTDFQNPNKKYTKAFTAAAGNRAESLLNKLGFEKETREIGKFASSKQVSEAVILIPYFDRPINIGVNIDTRPVGNNSADLTLDQESTDISIVQAGNEIPGNEIYSTREIVPGKHFLPYQLGLFENILSVILAREYSSQLGDESLQESFRGIDDFQSALDTDIGKMITTLLGTGGKKGYQLPPEFDFIHNASVKPFQMIVIPMNDTLRKQELIDIYQGIMPDSTIDLKKIISKIETSPQGVDSSASWFPTTIGFDGISNIGLGGTLSPIPIRIMQTDVEDLSIDRSSMPGWLKTSRDFYKNLKFMVFKVKQRGEKDYKSYRDKQIFKAIQSNAYVFSKAGAGQLQSSALKVDSANNIAKTILDKKINEVYGANWPYDYFSLIETAKIDVSIEVDD